MKSILAVDDAHANLQILQGLLSDEYDMRLAKSGKMALAALERVTPDLILLDIEMPEMSGFEVLDIINSNLRLKRIPIIFLTAHASREFVIEAAQKGAKDYIVKPFDPDLLRDKIKKALEG
jgi:putative two-component system response regulator